MSEAKEIVLARRGALAFLTIDRADKANALSAEMMATLSERINAAAHDPTVNALVLTGTGERAFCAGVDYRSASDLPADAARELRSKHFFELLIGLAGMPKAVVVAVNGVAAGGGAMLALLGDHAIAAEAAALTLPEIHLGTPTFAGLAVLVHAAGAALAADLVQSGRRMSAQEAMARGLYAEVVKADELAERAEKVALLLASKPAQAFALNKQWLRKPLLAALRDAETETRVLRARGPIQ